MRNTVSTTIFLSGKTNHEPTFTVANMLGFGCFSRCLRPRARAWDMASTAIRTSTTGKDSPGHLGDELDLTGPEFLSN